MPAPEISAFGDGSHAPGASGLTVDGAGFGAFPGSAWIYANSDRTGSADELTVGSWNDIQLSVSVPGSLTNSAGTRYLFVQREDLAWSNAQAFTLESGTATGTLAKTLGALTASAAGTLPLQATLAKMLGNVSLSAAGSLPLVSGASVTLGDLTLGGAGVLTVVGVTVQQLGGVQLVAFGAAGNFGVVSATLGGLTVSAAGVSQGNADLAVTLASIHLAASGSLGATGAAAITLAGLSASGFAAFENFGSGDALTLEPLAVQSKGRLANVPPFVRVGRIARAARP